MNDLISKKKTDQAVSQVQVTLNFSPRHFNMIQRCAELSELSVEEWVLQATEGLLRADMHEFGTDGFEVGFDNDDIDEVYEEIFGGPE